MPGREGTSCPYPEAGGCQISTQSRRDVLSLSSGGEIRSRSSQGKSKQGPRSRSKSRSPGPGPLATFATPGVQCGDAQCRAVLCSAVHPRGPCPGELQAGAQVQVQVAPGGQVQVQVQGPRSRSSQGSSNQAGPQAQVQIAPGGQGSPLIWVKLIWDYVNLSKLT